MRGGGLQCDGGLPGTGVAAQLTKNAEQLVDAVTARVAFEDGPPAVGRQAGREVAVAQDADVDTAGAELPRDASQKWALPWFQSEAKE